MNKNYCPNPSCVNRNPKMDYEPKKQHNATQFIYTSDDYVGPDYELYVKALLSTNDGTAPKIKESDKSKFFQSSSLGFDESLNRFEGNMHYIIDKITKRKNKLGFKDNKMILSADQFLYLFRSYFELNNSDGIDIFINEYFESPIDPKTAPDIIEIEI